MPSNQNNSQTNGNLYYNPNTISFICIRHGETPANVLNLAQGSSNDPYLNGLTESGVHDVSLSAKIINHELEGVNPENIWVYTPQLHRTIDTALIVAEELELLDGHFIVNSSLNTKKYGKIEGMKDVKSFKTISKNPLLGIQYILTELGIEVEGSGIETKPAFEDRTLAYMDRLLLSHKPGDVIIIACSSEHWNRFRKNKNINTYFNFSSKEPLKPGEFAKMEIKENYIGLIEELGNDYRLENYHEFS